MTTRAAAVCAAVSVGSGFEVFSRLELLAMGCTQAEILARLDADRWRKVGRAIVTHNGELTRHQSWRVAVINCGPSAVLTSFTAAEASGLTGWTRDEIHVLTPAGSRAPTATGLPIVVHRSTLIAPHELVGGDRRCHRTAPALVLAASSFRTPRPGCGLLAAGVQQRLTSAVELRRAVEAAPRTRHRRALLAAVGDIAMGAQALSEIDFVRLCRRNGLPPPTQQAMRVEPSGRRRYLDAEWVLRNGRRVVVEVDGAVHLAPRRWFDDQLRQNEISLTGALVLRFPSVVVRTEEPLVVRQLRRALGLRS